MRSIAGLIVFTLFLVVHAWAQRTPYASLKGTVIDSTSRQPVEAATVSVILLTDSSLVNYAITNKKGEFVLKDIPQAKPCRVLVSYAGLHSYAQDFVISPDTKELIINTVRLGKSFKEMEEVVVSAHRPPVMIKKDTLEFNAGSFKTPVNGVVEDLLKQLPGVEVDNEGNITVNGKKVSKITVDGKDFFGSDFKLTSKNLPKDIVDKIQVVDNKTREAQFNKTSTGNEDKAINITLKKDRKKGLFGRANGGYGSNDRYETGGNVNYFSGPLQFSFIGYANNTNRKGSSGGDFSISNPTSSFGSGSSGITTSRAAGLNGSYDLKSRLRVSGSYFFSNSSTTNTVSARRQNILPDTAFIYQSLSASNRTNNNHNAYLNMEYKPDTLTTAYFNANLSKSAGHSTTGNNALSTSNEGIKINEAGNLFTSRPDNDNVSLEAFIGRRLNNKGRSITLNVSFSSAQNNSLDSNKGRSVFYNPDGINREDTIDQVGTNSGRSKQVSTNVTWTEPISRMLYAQMSYSFVDSRTSSDKNTFRQNPVTGLYDLPDTTFTNASASHFRSHTPTVMLVYKSDKFRANAGTAAQWLTQSTQSVRPASHLDQRFSNLFPSLNLNYQYTKTGSINLNYNGRSQQPAAEQLQPAPNNSNPLYINMGNPSLKPSFYHSMGLNAQQYSSKSYLNVGLGVSVVSNQIVNETWFDSVQYTRPVNSNGNWGLSYDVTYSYSWKKSAWSLRLMMSNNGNYSRTVALSNKLTNITKVYSLIQRVSLAYTYKELFTLMPVVMVRYSDMRYSISQPQPTENITQNILVNAFVNWPKNFIIENNLQYNYNSRTAPGFPKGVTIWNVAVNYQFLKNKQASLRFAALDLLQENTSIFRNITPTYIEDTQVQVLKQYFLVSLLYNLQQFRR